MAGCLFRMIIALPLSMWARTRCMGVPRDEQGMSRVRAVEAYMCLAWPTACSLQGIHWPNHGAQPQAAILLHHSQSPSKQRKQLAIAGRYHGACKALRGSAGSEEHHSSSNSSSSSSNKPTTRSRSSNNLRGNCWTAVQMVI